MAETSSDNAGAGIDLSQFYQVFFEEAGENLARFEAAAGMVSSVRALSGGDEADRRVFNLLYNALDALESRDSGFESVEAAFLIASRIANMGAAFLLFLLTTHPSRLMTDLHNLTLDLQYSRERLVLEKAGNRKEVSLQNRWSIDLALDRPRLCKT